MRTIDQQPKPKTDEKDRPVDQPKTHTHTSHIEIEGMGEGDIGERFVSLCIQSLTGPIRALLRIDDLASKPAAFAGLNRQGFALYSPAARTELVNRIQAEGLKPTSFKVATQIGWHGDAFVFPDGVISADGKSKLRVCLDDQTVSLATKYRVSASKKWKEIPKLARRNSRMMLGLALSFVGPTGRITNVEQVAVQLVGVSGSGKTGISVAVGSVWGRHTDPNRARDLGFCETWNNTVNNFDVLAIAHSHTLLILDETRAGVKERSLADTALSTIMRLEKGAEKGRWTDTTALRSWWVPLLSTSNLSLDQLCAAAGIPLDDAYRSRLIDVGLPVGGFGVFEYLHGYPDVPTFTVRLKELAAECFGWAGRRFVRRLVKWLARDPDGLRAWFQKRRDYYLKRANQITAVGRQLDRIHQKFATIYAAGCLAIKFGILPWKRKELRWALLKCERDHVSLVAEHSAGALAAAPITDPFHKLLTFIQANQHRFHDVQSGRLPAGAAGPPAYVNHHKGGWDEFLFEAAEFDRMVGGKAAADRLKAQLTRHTPSLIATTGAGKQGKRFVVKRQLGPKARGTFVAVRREILDVGR